MSDDEDEEAEEETGPYLGVRFPKINLISYLLLLLFVVVVVTSIAGAVTKYYNEHVCVCVCLSVR